MSKKPLETLARLSVYAEFGAGDLIFRHAGRDFRLTDVSGKVVSDIIA